VDLPGGAKSRRRPASERTAHEHAVMGHERLRTLTMTQEQLYEAIDDAHSRERSMSSERRRRSTWALKAHERAQKWFDPTAAPYRAPHAGQPISSAHGGYRCDPTPFLTYVYHHGENGRIRRREDRVMFAHRSFLDAGIRVPGASDYTPGPFEPLMAIQSMVTRKDYRGRVWGPSQKVTVDEALTIATINGAYASSEENLKGSITAGKLADFVMLEKDPHDSEPDQIMNIKVNRTVIGGKTVYGG
jgi:hypothetical protein